MKSNGKEWERRPFLAIPDVGSYYPASSIQAARESVFRTLDRAEGTALIFGGTGLGKTLLLKLAASEFEIDGPVILLNGLRTMDRAGFLARILFELHQPITANNENALRIALFDFLRRSEYRRFVLLIDEAQSLPFSAFEEIRLLLDQESFREPLFRAALAGTEAFEERLNHPRLARFSQRIVSRSYLEPFLRDETGDYIDRQLRLTGGRFSETRFASEAKLFVHHSAGGVPRVINQLCDLALWLGPDEDGVFSESILRKAWGMLQQLPEENRPEGSAKISSDAAGSDSASDGSPAVVEFGTLDDGAACGVEFGTLGDEEPIREKSAPSVSVETESSSDSVSETVRTDEEPFDTENDESLESELFSIQLNAARPAETSADFSNDDEADEEFSAPVSDVDRLIGERLSEKHQDDFSGDSAFEPLHSADFSFDSKDETPLADDRLEELRLMEMEVAQEAALIRKIRDMHTGLESFRGTTSVNAASVNANANAAAPTADEPVDDDSNRKHPGGNVRAPYRPAAGSRRFRSAFKRLYPEE